jgi:death on curing protein
MEWKWIKITTVLAIHDEQLAEHGGSSGLRSIDLLESALARPQGKANYADPSAAELAAAYAFGIVKNHPFLDGHKRTGLVTAELFLAYNGFEFTATDQDCVETFEALAGNRLTETDLASWFEARMTVMEAKK